MKSQSVSSAEVDPATSDGVLRLPTKIAGVEGSTVVIVPERLTRDNYREWAQSMILALDGRD